MFFRRFIRLNEADSVRTKHGNANSGGSDQKCPAIVFGMHSASPVGGRKTGLWPAIPMPQ
jgi:hypothetical protein